MNHENEAKQKDSPEIIDECVDEATQPIDESSVEEEPITIVQTPPSELDLGAMEDAAAAGSGFSKSDAEKSLDDLTQLVKERDEYLNDVKRLQAEFDNYRKRSARERTELREYLLQEVFTRLLDVADNLSRAGQSSGSEQNFETFQQGVTMIHQQFMTIMSDYGVQRIETEGQPFDPNLHEAVGQVESDEHSPGTVVNEFMPGYQLKERVLRAPKVQIATAPTGGADTQPEPQTETKETEPDSSGT